ncbi:MAG: NAD(+)/NADH kinase [Desulfovibrio sp.]|nr:NAD(+)/NADH kinase [Desulfovibrio sp.]
MQKTTYKTILLITKTGHAPANSLAKTISVWLADHGCATTLCAANELPKRSLPDNIDLAIVLGGDGTMLGVGRNLAGKDIPILGINFGRVGFLTISDPDKWQETLERCFHGELLLQSRLTLQWTLTRNGTIRNVGNAVNDVVISHGPLARLVCINIRINDEDMGLLRCDGIILASPIGSSGYTASAGGPILFAKTDAFVFTPICPFLRSVSPMVFPSNVSMTVTLQASSTDTYLTVDGQEGYPLANGDCIEIKAKSRSVHFLGKQELFFERLRSRGLVLEQTYVRQGQMKALNEL